MKLVFRLLFFILFSIYSVALTAQNQTSTNHRLESLSKRLEPMEIEHDKSCITKAQKETETCKALIKQIANLEKKLDKVQNQISGNEGVEDQNTKDCKKSHEAFGKAITEKQKACTSAGLGSKDCDKELIACESGESKNKKCPGLALLGYKKANETYDKLEEQVDTANSNYNDLQDKINDKINELSKRTAAHADAKLEAEKVLTDTEKGKEQQKQDGAKYALDLQLQMNKLQLQIEDLNDSKVSAKLETENLIDDLGNQCFDFAVKDYNARYERCLQRRREKIKNGTLKTGGLASFYGGNYSGACSRKKEDYWIDVRKKRCLKRENFPKKKERIEQAYKRNIESTDRQIKRLVSAISTIAQKISTVSIETDFKVVQYLKDMKAQLAAAQVKAQKTQDAVNNLSQEIQQLRIDLNKKQQERFQVEARKNTSLQYIAELDGLSEETKIIDAKKFSEASSAFNNSINKYDHAFTTCNCNSDDDQSSNSSEDDGRTIASSVSLNLPENKPNRLCSGLEKQKPKEKIESTRSRPRSSN